jgi:tetratricopeptide (TPR) repeat protein
MLRTIFLVLLVTALWETGSGQTGAGDIRFRLAQSYERSGDYESAMKLYEELFTKDSANPLLFDALQKVYVQLKKYDEAVALFQQRLSKNPADPVLLSQLGIIYSRKSDEAKAAETWERAIGTAPKVEQTYRFVASAMVESRQFEKAADVYRRGRAACGNPMLFANELASLYSMMLKYSEATSEYLGLLRQNPAQLGYVQTRIALYTGRADGLAAATLAVEHAVAAEPSMIAFNRLLAWLYMEGRKFDSAFDVYKNLDSRLNAGGHELQGFAERALRERAFAAASKAFLEVENKYPSFDRMGEIKFGYARTLEESASERDTLRLFNGVNPFEHPQPLTESQPTSTGAVAAYERVVREYPQTELAAQSLCRIAEIKYNRFFDTDGARVALETVDREYAAFAAERADATLLLGDIFIVNGRLNDAATNYSLLVTQLPGSTEQKNTASLRLAELDYFRGNFQDALQKLGLLTKNPISDIANDALTLQIFIQENVTSELKPLGEFAAADLLTRQRKLSEALAHFESLIQTYPRSGIVDEALMEVGDLQTRLGRYADAIASYARLLKDFPESLVLDRAVMKTAEVCRWGTKDSLQAIEAYKKLLTDFPHSIYTSEARKRIRELRGDNI